MLKNDDYPAWLLTALPSARFGYVMLALGVLLAGLAWRRAGNTRILAGTFAVFALAFALNTVELRGMLAPDPERESLIGQAATDHVALQAPTLIGGLTLPAGTVVEWKTNEHKEADVEFPGKVLVEGIPLIGKFTLNEYFWDGDLAEDYVLDGWPCAAGNIYLGVDGHVQQCTLAGARALPTVTIPAGSQIYTRTNKEYDTPFAETKITLKTATADPADGAQFPAGAYLTLYSNGALEEAEAPQAPMQVRGLALHSSAMWRYGRQEPGAPPDGTPTEFVKGRLAADVRCADRTVPADTWVGVPPRGSALLVSDKDNSVEPSPVQGCFAGR